MEKARPVDLLAPLGGAMLLVSAFLEWFRYPDPEVIKLQQQFEVPDRNIETSATLITSTGWEVSSLRYILYLCAIAAIVNFFLLIMSRTPGRAAIFATPVTGLGALTAVWIAIRWINPPFDDAQVMSGLFVGLAGALLVVGGTFLALRDERVPSGFDQAPPAEMLSLPDLPSAAAAQKPAGDPVSQSSAEQPPVEPPATSPAKPGDADRDASVAPPRPADS